MNSAKTNVIPFPNINPQAWVENILKSKTYFRFRSWITFTDNDLILTLSFAYQDFFDVSEEMPEPNEDDKRDFLWQVAMDECAKYFKDTQFDYMDCQHLDDGFYLRDYSIPMDSPSFRSDLIQVFKRLSGFPIR